MKKTFLAAFLMGCALHAFAQSGIIRELSGEVELRLAGSAEFTPAAVGSEVAQDTIVSTGFRSSAIIEIGSTTLTVRPLTRLSLTEIRAVAGAENTNVNLQAGRVRVDVRPPAGTTANFTLQSPSATASVRGTSFEVDSRSVRVLDGAVSFRGATGVPVMVQAGGESVVGAGGRTADPVQSIFQALSPPTPVGVGASGETVGAITPAATTGSINIIITY
ncbi:MAG: FecR family protein [Treponema sp.]|nr:FecR family protein [Treponema sp.]